MIITVEKRKRVRLGKPEYVAVLAAALILAFTLMKVPVTGVADNGDFARIMSKVNLSHMTDNYTDNYFGYATRQFRITNTVPSLWGYFSTEIPLVAAAISINKSFLSGDIFDIRFLSAIYSLFLLAAFFMIVRITRKKAGTAAGWLIAALLLLVFTDIGYIAYFNSLYGEAVSLAFLLFAAGAALWLAGAEKPGILTLIAFFAGMIMFVGAKVQNSPLAIPAAIFGLGLIKLRQDKAWKRTIVISTALMVIIAGLSYFTISPDIKTCNKYQTVFYGILKDSPDPEQDLKELGLDTRLAVLAGTNYFMEEYPLDIRSESFKNYIYENVSHLKIASFYLRHPDRLLKKLEIAASNGFRIRQGMGNYEKAPGITYKQTAEFPALWSNFKENVLPHSLLFVVCFLALIFLALLPVCIRSLAAGAKSAAVICGLLMLIGVIGLSQLVLPIIGDGEADLSKHLFLFNVGFDLLFVTAVTVSVTMASAAVARALARLRLRVRAE